MYITDYTEPIIMFQKQPGKCQINFRWRSTANYNKSLAFSIQYILSIQPNMQANSFHIVYQLMHCQHSEFQSDTKLQVEEVLLIRKTMCHYPYVKLRKARATKTLKTSS